MLGLASCATTTGSVETNAAAKLAACQSFEPIPWSTKDTDQTILGVKKHNAAWKAVCGG